MPDEEEGHVFGVKGFDAFAKFIVDGYVCTKFIYGRLPELRKFALCDFGEINERAAAERELQAERVRRAASERRMRRRVRMEWFMVWVESLGERGIADEWEWV